MYKTSRIFSDEVGMSKICSHSCYFVSFFLSFPSEEDILGGCVCVCVNVHLCIFKDPGVGSLGDELV